MVDGLYLFIYVIYFLVILSMHMYVCMQMGMQALWFTESSTSGKANWEETESGDLCLRLHCQCLCGILQREKGNAITAFVVYIKKIFYIQLTSYINRHIYHSPSI